MFIPDYNLWATEARLRKNPVQCPKGHGSMEVWTSLFELRLACHKCGLMYPVPEEYIVHMDGHEYARKKRERREKDLRNQGFTDEEIGFILL
jgi:uncharacterized protein YbaR (Trm112 family)